MNLEQGGAASRRLVGEQLQRILQARFVCNIMWHRLSACDDESSKR
jgi:hypothetical protein